MQASRETLDRTMTDVAIVILPEQTGDFFPQPADAEWATRNELGASRTAH